MMNNKIFSILNQVQTFRNNINKQMQPMQNVVNDLHIKMQPFHNTMHIWKLKAEEYYAEKSLTDEGLESYEQIEILNNSLKLSDIQSYQYFQKNTKLNFITLLKNINRNHIQKSKDDKYIYSFIYELLEEKSEIKSKLGKINKDRKDFNRLQKKYDIQPTEKYNSIVKNSQLQINQIIPFLYLYHYTNLKEEGTKDIKLEDNMKSLFSILFYDKSKQKTFYKNVDMLNNFLHNMHYDFLDIFFQYDYIDKN